MHITLKSFTGQEALQYIDELARLRIEVFREFPYLYDGSREYEKEYLQSFTQSSECLVVVAFDGDQVVGVSTGKPLEHEARNVQKPWKENGHDLSKIFYYGESVLQKNYRGYGIGVKFFHYREEWARRLKRFRTVCFCAVVRPDDHPLKPKEYQPLGTFWKKRGFKKIDNYKCRMFWKDVDGHSETEKELVFWQKPL